MVIEYFDFVFDDDKERDFEIKDDFDVSSLFLDEDEINCVKGK